MNKRTKTTILIFIIVFTQLYNLSSASPNESQHKLPPIKRYLRYLKSGSVQLKRVAVRKLSLYHDIKAVQPLIKALAHRDYEVQFYAKKSLIKLGKLALPQIIKSLNNRKYKIRKRSAEILGEMKNSSASLALIRTLKNDKHPLVRTASAEALGKIMDQKSVPYLIKSLKDRDWRVRSSSAKALGLLKNEKSLVPLTKAIKDHNSYVRIRAAGALGRLKNKKAVPYLIQALKDGSAETRETVCWALGRIKDKRAVRPLLHALVKDNSGTVRKEARAALKNMGYTSKEIDDFKNRR